MQKMHAGDMKHTLALSMAILSNAGNSIWGLEPKSISGWDYRQIYVIHQLPRDLWPRIG